MSERIYAARVLYPVHNLGPGERVGIWLSGCARRCPGCISPELWQRHPEQCVSVSALLGVIGRLCAARGADGFTVSGGEPFEQTAALGELLSGLRALSRDILVFTGCEYERLMEDAAARECIGCVALLVDGPYIDARNRGEKLRGSDNQRMLLFDESLRGRYEDYLAGAGMAPELFACRDGAVLTGIQPRGYGDMTRRAARAAGVKAAADGADGADVEK